MPNPYKHRRNLEHEYVIPFVFTALHFEYFFNSLGYNAIGHVGALQLADGLKVNKSLRCLE